MSKLSEFRWSRGLFRLWLVGACLWAPIAFLSFVAENPPPKADPWAEFQPGQGGLFDDVPRAKPKVPTFDHLPVADGSEPSFEDLIPSGPELRTDDGLSTPSFPPGQLERFAQAATVAIVPPVAVLLAFFVLRWVMRGFRAT